MKITEAIYIHPCIYLPLAFLLFPTPYLNMLIYSCLYLSLPSRPYLIPVLISFFLSISLFPCSLSCSLFLSRLSCHVEVQLFFLGGWWERGAVYHKHIPPPISLFLFLLFSFSGFLLRFLPFFYIISPFRFLLHIIVFPFSQPPSFPSPLFPCFSFPVPKFTLYSHLPWFLNPLLHTLILYHFLFFPPCLAL